MTTPNHKTTYRITAQMVTDKDGKIRRVKVKPYTAKHRPGAGLIYTIKGPDRELAVENCRKCRPLVTVTDNRNIKV